MNNKISYLFFITLFLHFSIYAQNNKDKGIEIIDISGKQIELMNKVQNEPIEKRNLILLDSIYKPYSNLWSNYLGSELNFTNWINNTGYKELEGYSLNVKDIDLLELNKYLFQTGHEMHKFTGKKPEGIWYIFFGPKWTNLGSLYDGTMLIDLAHKSNKSLADIKIHFPHEINHQIFSNTIEQNDNAVLNRILNEGFACYVSYLFHNGKTTIAEELGFTETEYISCIKNEKELIKLLKKNYKSNSKKISNNFASRSYRYSEKFPGAVGYYIGFRIIDEYVKRNGENSWKNIYDMLPEEVLKKSRILK